MSLKRKEIMSLLTQISTELWNNNETEESVIIDKCYEIVLSHPELLCLEGN